jgi:hypothetical protein
MSCAYNSNIIKYWVMCLYLMHCSLSTLDFGVCIRTEETYWILNYRNNQETHLSTALNSKHPAALKILLLTILSFRLLSSTLLEFAFRRSIVIRLWLFFFFFQRSHLGRIQVYFDTSVVVLEFVEYFRVFRSTVTHGGRVLWVSHMVQAIP